MLRHVSEAFAEDPVRILRVARFAARFGFRVARETMRADAGRWSQSGEADYLVPERVWQEFSKGLMEEHPERMFEVLEACGLRERLLPELETQPEADVGLARGALRAARLAARRGRGGDALPAPAGAERARASSRCWRAATASALEAAAHASPEELLELLKRTDALRRPERFAELLEVARLAAHGIDFARLERARAAAAAVDAGAIAARRRRRHRQAGRRGAPEGDQQAATS